MFGVMENTIRKFNNPNTYSHYLAEELVRALVQGHVQYPARGSRYNEACKTAGCEFIPI